MRRVILIRHGESALNAASKQQKMFCGQFETPLTERGREQARSVGRQLAKRAELRINHSISSCLGRARETLELILSQLPNNPELLTPVSAFNERSLGAFEGRLEEDVFHEFPQYRSNPQFCAFREDFEQKAPNGENFSDVTLRAWSAFEELLPRTTGDLLIVSHCNTIRCLIGRALRLSQKETLQLRIRHALPIVFAGGPRNPLGRRTPDSAASESLLTFRLGNCEDCISQSLGRA
jgi:broad specificity phosphatase PhoE